MIVYIGNEKIQVENSIDEIEPLLDRIANDLEKKSMILEALEIDGIDVFTDFGEYLFKNISSIVEIRVRANTVHSLIESVLVNTLHYIENSIPILEAKGNRLKSTDLSDLVEGISWILETFIYIDSDENLKKQIVRKEEWNLYAREVYRLKEILPALLKNSASQDKLELASIISDLVDIYKAMTEKIINLVRID